MVSLTLRTPYLSLQEIRIKTQIKNIIVIDDTRYGNPILSSTVFSVSASAQITLNTIVDLLNGTFRQDYITTNSTGESGSYFFSVTCTFGPIYTAIFLIAPGVADLGKTDVSPISTSIEVGSTVSFNVTVKGIFVLTWLPKAEIYIRFHRLLG